MKKIKHIKDDKIIIDGVVWKPYYLNDIPQSFGCMSGIKEWINYRGYCYIKE
tara:strand:+ start:684 stop:839 length:156 start_codon:yes stop_codon:yes gene_type:complete